MSEINMSVPLSLAIEAAQDLMGERDDIIKMATARESVLNDQIAQLTKERDELRDLVDKANSVGYGTAFTRQIERIQKERDQLTKEREELEQCRLDSITRISYLGSRLKTAEENDWTSSLIDRLNEFVRENRTLFEEVNNGKEASKLIQMIHGQFNVLKSERDQLAAKCKELEASKKLVIEAANNGMVERELDKLLVHAIEFYNDWKKGDFDLPKLAQLDMEGMANHFNDAKKALEQYEKLNRK